VFSGYHSNTFRSGTGAILYTGLQLICNGTELSLNECRNNYYYRQFRTHDQDNGVGVQCDHFDNSGIVFVPAINNRFWIWRWYSMYTQKSLISCCQIPTDHEYNIRQLLLHALYVHCITQHLPVAPKPTSSSSTEIQRQAFCAYKAP